MVDTREYFRETYGIFLNGEEVPAAAGGMIAVEDPANGAQLCSVAEAREEDVDRCVRAAREAFEDGRWSELDPRERARVLNKAAEKLREEVPRIAMIESLSTGRPIREMRAQLGRLPEWLEYFAALIRTHEGTVPPFFGNFVNYVRRVPLGVVAQITPWNHPLLIAIKKVAPALATGNSVVIKPSELAPVAVLELARILTEAGVPAGVIAVVTGYGATAGKALSEHPEVDMVDLTGGTPTGRLVASAAGRNLSSCVMELGGKAPVLVFEDADIDAAVNGAAFAAFIASGQTCIQGSRILVHESIKDEFVARFVAKVEKIRCGKPQEQSTWLGPVISKPQMDRVLSYVQVAKDEGAAILCGGKQPDDPDLQNGYFIEPTVIGNCTRKMRVVQEEIFGPVVVILSFSDEADAIETANDSPFGLAAGIWTTDVRRAHRVAHKLKVGIVWINDHHKNDPSSPWGGMKDSGIGRENGVDALHHYTQSQSVVVAMDPKPVDWFVTGDVRYS